MVCTKGHAQKVSGTPYPTHPPPKKKKIKTVFFDFFLSSLFPEELFVAVDTNIYIFSGSITWTLVYSVNITAPTSMFVFQNHLLVVDSPAYTQIIDIDITSISLMYGEHAVGSSTTFLAPYDVIVFHGVIPGNSCNNLIISF